MRDGSLVDWVRRVKEYRTDLCGDQDEGIRGPRQGIRKKKSEGGHEGRKQRDLDIGLAPFIAFKAG